MKNVLFGLIFIVVFFVTACSNDEIQGEKDNNKNSSESETKIGVDKDHPIEVTFGESFIVNEEESKFVDRALGKAEVTFRNYVLEKDYYTMEPEDDDGSSRSLEELNAATSNGLRQELNNSLDFVHFDISLNNLSDISLESSFLSHHNFEFYNAAGKAIEASVLSDSEYKASELRAGGSNSGHIIFEIPEGEIPSEIIFTADFPINDVYYGIPIN